VENEEKKASDQQHIAGYPMNLEGQGDDNQKYQRHHWAQLARLPFSTVFFRLQIKIIIHRKPSHAVLSASQQEPWDKVLLTGQVIREKNPIYTIPQFCIKIKTLLKVSWQIVQAFKRQRGYPTNQG